MLRSCLLFFLALPAAWSGDGELMSRTDCSFPDYEKAGRIEPYATRSEYDQVVQDKRFTCERIIYASGGLPVVAFFYRPDDRRTLPLIVFNRGSWIVNDQLPLHVVMFRRLAEAGFAVIAPMYRGSEGAPGRDEMGGAELADLFNVLPLAKQIGSMDLERVFLYGASRGGVMTLMALRDGFPARAAATWGAFTDLEAYLDKDSRAKKIVTTIWPDFAQQREQIFATRSASQWPERIRVPLLLMHGGADPQVNLIHTLYFASQLQELGRPCAVQIFGGDNHVLAERRVDRDQEAIRWFRDHL